MPVAVVVPVREVLDVLSSVARFAGPDERDSGGAVWLDVDASGRRRWSSAIDVIAMSWVAGPHGGPVFPPVRIGPRVLPAGGLLSALHREFDAGDDVTFLVPAADDDEQRVTVSYGPVQFHHPTVVPGGSCPAGRVVQPPVAAVAATMPALLLYAACEELRAMPRGVDVGRSYPPPPFRLSVAPGEMAVSVNWPGFGLSKVSVAGVDCVGHTSVWVSVAALSEVLGVCDLDGPITIAVPLDDGPVHLRSGRLSVAVDRWSPYLSDAQARERVAAAVVDAVGGDPAVRPPSALHGPADGRLWAVAQGHPVAVDVLGGERAAVTFTACLGDVAVDPDMANLVNGVLRGGRMFTDDGLLCVAVDLFGTPSADEVRHVLGRLVEHVDMVTPFVVADADRLT